MSQTPPSISWSNRWPWLWSCHQSDRMSQPAGRKVNKTEKFSEFTKVIKWVKIDVTRCLIHQTNFTCLNFRGSKWFYDWLRYVRYMDNQSWHINCGTPCSTGLGGEFTQPCTTTQGDHSACDEPPRPLTSEQKFRFGLARPAYPGQSGTFVVKTTGGSSQAEWSPCTWIWERCKQKLIQGLVGILFVGQ